MRWILDLLLCIVGNGWVWNRTVRRSGVVYATDVGTNHGVIFGERVSRLGLAYIAVTNGGVVEQYRIYRNSRDIPFIQIHIRNGPASWGTIDLLPPAT